MWVSCPDVGIVEFVNGDGDYGICISSTRRGDRTLMRIRRATMDERLHAFIQHLVISRVPLRSYKIIFIIMSIQIVCQASGGLNRRPLRLSRSRDEWVYRRGSGPALRQCPQISCVSTDLSSRSNGIYGRASCVD